MTVIDEISKAFNKQALHYERVAKVQHEIGLRLLERLSYLKIEPRRILDLGCGPGHFSRELSRLYPNAELVGLDLAPAMLKQAYKKQGWRRKWFLVAADMKAMPFDSGAFDLVFANQVIHWGGALAPTFRELNRVMRPNGCFMFTTLGPDTFKELQLSWSTINDYAHVNEFMDMHDVGDALLEEYFLDPVMDMEHLFVHYKSLNELVRALKDQGVRNVNAKRHQGLTGKAAWQQFEKNYRALQTEQGHYPLTYEVVYGHAWKGEQRRTERGIETLIPISQLVR
jgi:malonyl-CoA O-methyltransferase